MRCHRFVRGKRFSPDKLDCQFKVKLDIWGIIFLDGAVLHKTEVKAKLQVRVCDNDSFLSYSE